MIAVTDLSKAYAVRTLFAGVSLHLDAGHRYGLIGANGSGKSTFLRILAGEESATSGTVSIPKRLRLGLLRQDRFLSDRQRILDVVLMGHPEVFEAMQEKERLLADAESDFDHERFSELEDVIAQHDGYSLEARAGEVLEGLGIPTEVHDSPLSTLSGGFKLRALLAQALASNPDVLLLDEPTNHLDILSIRWLEKFLVTFSGCAVVISHDHRFLDNVCTQVLDVDYETITQYPGNYSAFVAAKQGHRERMEAEIKKREKQIADHQAFIDRFKAKATKARQASSKKKQLERITIEKLPETSRRHPRFKFKQSRPSGRDALEVKGLSKSYGDNHVLADVSLTVQRGDRLAIIGPNGIGKSTLLKILVGDLQADAGRVTWGYEARPGYFAQDLGPLKVAGNATVLSWLWDVKPGESVGFVRGKLGEVLFSGDDVEKRVAALSGGEAARLTFARLSVEEPNVLVLDEPTNHLDLEAIEALVAGLKQYDGTLILVSHDRWFVQEVATRIIEIRPDGMEDFRGTYEEYVAFCGDDHLDVEVALKKARQKKVKQRPEPAGSRAPASGLSKAERRRLTSEHQDVTAEISRTETRIKEIDELFCEPGFYETRDARRVRELQEEHSRLGARLGELMARWEELEESLSAGGR